MVVKVLCVWSHRWEPDGRRACDRSRRRGFRWRMCLCGLSDAETRQQTARDRLGVVKMQNDDFLTVPKVRSECTSHSSEDNRKDR